MKKGKVVLIGGCPRAGKTTVSVGLAKEGGYSKVSLDSLSESLNKGFPEIIIKDWTNQEECAIKKFDFFKTFIETLINDAEIYGLNFVFDMYDFTPEYIEKLPFKEKLEVYFLGFPDISIEEIKYNIKHYAKPTDWIAEVDDDYLEIVAKRIFNFNLKLKKQCEIYSYKFIDTGVGDNRSIYLTLLYDNIIVC